MNFEINKGIGRNVEFKGLESQYLFVFAAGLLAVFVVFVILYMAGVNQWVCIGFGVASATLLVWLTFRLNARYGTHGLMKAAARKRHPRYVLNRLKIPRLFTTKTRKNEKCNESGNAGKQVPALGCGERLHREQGCGRDGSLPGGTAGTVHRYPNGVRGDTFGVAQGGKGTAGLLHRA